MMDQEQDEATHTFKIRGDSPRDAHVIPFVSARLNIEGVRHVWVIEGSGGGPQKPAALSAICRYPSAAGGVVREASDAWQTANVQVEHGLEGALVAAKTEVHSLRHAVSLRDVTLVAARSQVTGFEAEVTRCAARSIGDSRRFDELLLLVKLERKASDLSAELANEKRDEAAMYRRLNLESDMRMKAWRGRCAGVLAIGTAIGLLVAGMIL